MIYVIPAGTEVRVAKDRPRLEWMPITTRKPVPQFTYESSSRGTYIFRESGVIIAVEAWKVKKHEGEVLLCGTCCRKIPDLPCRSCSSGVITFEDPISPDAQHVESTVNPLANRDVIRQGRFF